MEGRKQEISVEEIAAIPGLVESACRMRELARERGTLTRAEARSYWSAIAKLHGDHRLPASWIARRIGISRGRVWQLIGLHALTSPSTEEAAA